MSFWKKHKNDILLIAAVLVLAAGALLWQQLSKQPGAEAVVTVDGAEVWRAPLAKEAQWDYIGDDGQVGNRVVIEDGTVRVDSADCPDKVCVNTGRIRSDGEMIVCLPHKLIVRVIGASGGVDAVAN